MVSLAAAPAKAQVSLSVNIGSQPQWGPRGYDHVDYYYLPDVDCYYDVPSRNYIYLEGGNWVHRGYLPARYRDYDLYGGRKVVINSRNPWLHHNTYRTRYVTNYRGRGYYGGYNHHRPVISRRSYGGGYNHGNYGPRSGNRSDFRGNHHGGWDRRGGSFRDNGRNREAFNQGGHGRGGDKGNHGGGNDHNRGGGRRG